MSQLLPRVGASDAGLDPAAVDRLFRALDGIRDVHSAMVVHDGAVVAEGWWQPYAADEPHLLFSVAKSVTSAAVGLAIGEGLLTLDDRVIDLLPDDAPTHPDERLAGLRMRHLLTMTSGHDGDAMRAVDEQPAGAGRNWTARMLALPIVDEPGTRFVYNTGATYLLAAILHRVTAEHLVDYLMPRLFEPLGIPRPTWEEDPRGIVVGGYGLSLTTEQLAVFGQFLLQRGRWAGRQLLPAEWVVEATGAQVPNGPDPAPDWEQGYGFQYWRCRHGAYRADGAFGQFAVVWPAARTVVAITGGIPDTRPVLEAIWAAFPQFSGGAIAETGTDASNHAEAADESAAPLDRSMLAVPTVAGVPRAVIEATVAGRRYAVDANPLGLVGFEVRRDAEGRIEVSIDRDRVGTGAPAAEHVRSTRIVAAYGSWHPGVAALGERTERIAASAAWRDGSTLVVRALSISTPFSWTLTLSFAADGGSARIVIDRNVAFGPTHVFDGVGRADLTDVGSRGNGRP